MTGYIDGYDDASGTEAPEEIWRVAAYIPQHYQNGLASRPKQEHAGENPTPYVRRDLYDTLKAERDALAAENETLRKNAFDRALLEGDG